MVRPRDAALLALGLLLTPAFAFSDGAAGARSASASVVSPTNAYLYAEVFDATLSPANAYTADAAKARHDYDEDATLDLVVTKTAGDARFVLVAPTTLAGAAAGQSLTVQVRDTDPVNTPTSTSITLRFDATLRSAGNDVGAFTVSRTVAVVVL